MNAVDAVDIYLCTVHIIIKYSGKMLSVYIHYHSYPYDVTSVRNGTLGRHWNSLFPVSSHT
jgi:hypothetical protein